jgi:hypothetical protein
MINLPSVWELVFWTAETFTASERRQKKEPKMVRNFPCCRERRPVGHLNSASTWYMKKTHNLQTVICCFTYTRLVHRLTLSDLDWYITLDET